MRPVVVLLVAVRLGEPRDIDPVPGPRSPYCGESSSRSTSPFSVGIGAPACPRRRRRPPRASAAGRRGRTSAADQRAADRPAGSASTRAPARPGGSDRSASAPTLVFPAPAARGSTTVETTRSRDGPRCRSFQLPRRPSHLAGRRAHLDPLHDVGNDGIIELAGRRHLERLVLEGRHDPGFRQPIPARLPARFRRRRGSPHGYQAAGPL